MLLAARKHTDCVGSEPQGMVNKMGQVRKPWSIFVAGFAMLVAASAWGKAQIPRQQGVQAPCATEPGRMIECVRPSETDSTIRRFDDAHYVLDSARAKVDADLLVFMTGTSGEPPGPRRFLEEAADAGLRRTTRVFSSLIKIFEAGAIG
jgi:hypothetical protein